MSKLLLLITFILVINSCPAQSGIWTWMGGGPTDYGYYGKVGVRNNLNYPCARVFSTTWTDKDGNFWLFGGSSGYVGPLPLNDLWEYIVDSNMWVWRKGPQFNSNVYGHYGIKGIPSPSNYPPGLVSATGWTDTAGDLWLFAGAGYDSAGSPGYPNDLWRYNVKLNEWTWVNGPGIVSSYGLHGSQGVFDPSYYPGGCVWASATWVDNGNNLWFFHGGDNTLLNELWKYNVAKNEWAWVKGWGKWHYGKMGVEDTANAPEGRYDGYHWVDKNDNLYLTGGNCHSLSDGSPVWRFNTSTNNWTWITGSNTLLSDSGYCVHHCTAAYGDYPTNSEFFTISPQYRDCSDIFWRIGGENQIGYPTNEIWVFNPKTLKWIWVSGDHKVDSCIYGIKGVPASTNRWANRYDAAGWMDKHHNIWVFSGINTSLYSCASCVHNDLWRYVPDTSCFHWNLTADIVQGHDTTFCPGHAYYVFNVKDMPNMHVEPATDVVQVGDSLIFTPKSTTTYTVYFDNAGCNGQEGIKFTINILQGPLADFKFYPPQANVEHNTVKIINTSNTTGKFTWIYNSTAYSHNVKDTTLSLPAIAGNYCVSLAGAGDSNICIDTVTYCIKVIDTALLFVPSAFSPNWDGVNDVLYPIILSNNLKLKTFNIYNRWGQQVFGSNNITHGWDGTFSGQAVDIGVYVYYIEAVNTIDAGKTVLKKGCVTLVR